MIKSKNPQVVFLSETKCQGDKCYKKLGVFKDWNLKYGYSIGRSGGLVLLWRKDVDLKVIELDTHFISARIKDKDYNSLWRVIFVYGQPNKDIIKEFYNLIIRKIKLILGPLMCFGDWNCIWDRKDKMGGNRIPNSCLKKANRILDKEKLMDLGHFGPPFTWRNKVAKGVKRKDWIGW